MISDLMLLFDSLPDNTFKLEEINITEDSEKEDRVSVVWSKNNSPKLFNQFDEIQISINENGQRTISFTRNYFSKKDSPQIITIINEFYSKFGIDSEGNSLLNQKNIQELLSPADWDENPFVVIKWEKDGAITAWLNKKFRIVFYDVDSNNKKELLEKYYQPFIEAGDDGLLIYRKPILDKTSAKVISDEFSKGIVIGITEIAGDKDDSYIYTYALTDNKITTIAISFAYSGGVFFIQLKSSDYYDLYQLDSGDGIIFLFQNEEILEITFNKAHTVFKKPAYSGDRAEYSNIHVLRIEELILFMSQPLKKWKLIQNNKAYKVGGFLAKWSNHKHYMTVLEGQYLLQKMAKELVNAAIEKDPSSFDNTLIETLQGKPVSTTNSNLALPKQQHESIDEILAELNSLIGLSQVKKEVKTLTNFIKIQKAREQAGLKSSNISYHVVFTGNPGTGKTTVARIIAKIYKCLGILKKGQLIEVDRAGLIGEYLGQTAPKVNKVVDSALDGVLFIDEAYSIAASKTDEYGKEAVAALIKRVEDNRDRLAVIMAGYNEEMLDFINTNPGFSSRFNRYINFPDYAPDELICIFQSLCKQNDYMLEDEAKYKLEYIIEQVCINKDKTFGNARYIRNLFEKALERQSNRLSIQLSVNKESLITITSDDIPS